MIWNLLEKQLFPQKACLTISNKPPLEPGGDLNLMPQRKVEQKGDLASSSEQGSEPK